MIDINGYLINPAHVAYVGPPTSCQNGPDHRTMKIGFSGGGTVDLLFYTPKDATDAHTALAQGMEK